VPTAPDTELDAEQAHLDLAYACLDFMRDRAVQLQAAAPADLDLQSTLKRRINQLTDTGRALCFGRLDTDEGESWHIGRRHVENEASEPVVVEWRAPIAVPFYRATIEEPLGLRLRRQFVVDRRTLLSMADDLFGPDAAERALEGPQVRGRDALLAELERGRTGQMLDIVATIQAEQDVVIRAPMPGILTVQGGPGTGKTAIGLHRAAFLLFGNDALARMGVLVVGPNRTFLRYIAQVLPSLGEEAVVQTTLSDLVPDAPVRVLDEPPDVARLKGDARMAAVLRRSLVVRRRRIVDDLDVRHQARRIVVPADAVNEIAALVASRRIPYAAGRTTMRDLLARTVYERLADRVGSASAEYASISRSLSSNAEFKAALDLAWPSVSPSALVRELLSSRARLAEAADGVLSASEQSSLLRKGGRSARTEPWTEADGPLVDEAIELIDGRLRTYGHGIVDEAQDLSPMQARMLARRVPSGSLTILGDIAQGTGVWARDQWDDLLQHLPAPDGVRLEELRLGYRAPGRVLALASKLLPVIAPHLQPTESIRPGRSDPRFVRVAVGEVAAAAAVEAAGLATHWGSVAVIVPNALHDDVVAALAAAGADLGDAEREGLDHAVTVVPAVTAKGLEFDAVVVVEPAALVDDAPRGLRLLYIALTRPTQHLSVVHGRPLPEPLPS
jgi:DNA helicase IV